MKTTMILLTLLVTMMVPTWGQSPVSKPDSQPTLGKGTTNYTITPMGDPNNDYNSATAISSNGIVAGSTFRR